MNHGGRVQAAVEGGSFICLGTHWLQKIRYRTGPSLGHRFIYQRSIKSYMQYLVVQDVELQVWSLHIYLRIL
jgi:hypothetical protein